MLSRWYVYTNTHIHTYIHPLRHHNVAKHAYKDVGRACLEKHSHNIQADFVTVTCIVFVFLKFLKAGAMVYLHWLKCITLCSVNENYTN